MQKLTKTGKLERFDWERAESSENMADASKHLVHVSDFLTAQDKSTIAGIWVKPEDNVDELQEHLEQVKVIGIDFPVFTDGRGFSHARKLRDVLAFDGELIALGAFMQDQLFYLKRCGFDSFVVENDAPIESMKESLADFSETYQAAADEPRPLFRRR